MSIQSINARNQFRGKIRRSSSARWCPGGRGHAGGHRHLGDHDPFGQELDLQVGTEVLAFVKATEVSVAKL